MDHEYLMIVKRMFVVRADDLPWQVQNVLFIDNDAGICIVIERFGPDGSFYFGDTASQCPFLDLVNRLSVPTSGTRRASRDDVILAMYKLSPWSRQRWKVPVNPTV